ncbi:hypothetical protein OPKNFCMD_4415 [Methylobacterium crusticola]|uniref:Tellurite resistance TerB family protein n=1 Tax=Methylobacterium crusticola TaxID=1697972 RepID=A0ABQ4R1V4_9HYPH|nr:tellurite resistance TerB family protein [Methylobacterium crusticola]GJD51660.1 hypothetical protein OPKNFCMD_4415 [Methylobacterium crusticola]
MLDAKRLLDQFLGGPAAHRAGSEGRPGPASPLDQIGRALGGQGSQAAVLGGLASLVLGARRGPRAGPAGRLGGLALVGSLAYQAYRQWQASQPAAETRPPGGTRAAPPGGRGGFIPSPEEAGAMLRGTRFQPASPADEQDLSRALLTAMIAAAKADGHIDAQEQARIFGEMDRHALDQDDKAFLMDALRAPLDVEAVARLARGREEASAIYAASALAVSVDTPAERAYLDRLAGRLGLDPGLARRIEDTVAAASSQR